MVKKWDVTIPKLSGETPRKAYIYLPDDYEETADHKAGTILSQSLDKGTKLNPKVENKIRLTVATPIEVILSDERLTTVSAYQTMREMNISQKKKNTYADRLAATYILEGYLNSISK